MRKSPRQRKEQTILGEQTAASPEALQPSGTPRENDPENVREEIISAHFSGPIPLPSRFREYDEILPGSAECLLKMAENEQTGRSEWDRAALDGALNENRRGQYLGTFLSVIFTVVAVILAMYDRELPASAFAVACVASAVFHYKSWRPK